MQTKIITLLSALLLFSCSNKKSDVATTKRQTITTSIKKNNSVTIKSIAFERKACYGTCPVFKLSIREDNTATFEGFKYTKFIGKATKKLPDATFKKVAKQLVEMKIKNLKNNYAINRTDHATAILTISFEDGTQKIITDYGLEGTPELKRLYAELTKIGTTTNWKAP